MMKKRIRVLFGEILVRTKIRAGNWLWSKRGMNGETEGRGKSDI